MNLSFYIGKRYLSATKGKGFVSFISVVSVLGIAVGIMALIVVLSVMNGVTSEVREKILSMTAHAKIVGVQDYIDPSVDIADVLPDSQDNPEIEQIIASAPYIEGQALIGIGQSYQGVQVKGIDAAREPAVSEVIASLGDEVNGLAPGEFNVIIGKSLSDQLGIYPGDKLTLVVPKTTVSAAGIIPRIKRFTVISLFESGHFLYDTGLILIDIDDAATLFQRSGYDGYQLKLADLFAAQTLTESLNQALPSPYYAIDWTSQNRTYFDAVKVEKAAMFFILLIIVMVAAFNILSTLVMVVNDKQSDIAILRTIGVTPQTIQRVFMIQGTALGLIGTILGVVGGVLFAKQVPNLMQFLEANFGFRLPAELYFISSLNPKIEVGVIVLIALCALLLSFLATIYPAFKAARTDPARALAYE
ncbi:lipoprotein-releasing ABC transporter permease subunit [Ostreibacterium oceani]|uniref:Lipoprotein-releasing ABC transporter permease subunit n=1 Tax=Ostreibacterium oceani TaxID=2654998 RepID=A0A6N7ESW0_9GAMM|nr:lipoprotein-releasing ABC transporter permease subunit [Ostreibacterium oceani]MPV85631.1 lipoprotein-releasing ABC transporter permease subunit [Ostreibacterium oceani]